MKLQNEFSVNVPLERAWETLLDIETVAGFLPGAKIEPTDEEGVYRGAMKIRVGPMAISYEGTARLADVNQGARTADIEVRAKEAKGQGTASAVIHNQLVEENGATRVIAVTDLQVTGRQAQFGRGIMQDVAGRMLGDFARRFEAHLTASANGGERADASAPPRPPPADTQDALDLGNVVGQLPLVRYGAPAAGAMVLLALLVVALRARRHQRGITVRFGFKL